MGFFSWKTRNTKKSIANTHSSRVPLEVAMVAPNGDQWTESDYQGYGEFGGKDYYELLAEINGYGSDRSIGIDIHFNHKDRSDKNLQFPQLFDISYYDIMSVKGIDFSKPPEDCEYQGFFYPEDDEDEEE